MGLGARDLHPSARQEHLLQGSHFDGFLEEQVHGLCEALPGLLEGLPAGGEVQGRAEGHELVPFLEEGHRQLCGDRLEMLHGFFLNGV